MRGYILAARKNPYGETQSNANNPQDHIAQKLCEFLCISPLVPCICAEAGLQEELATRIFLSHCTQLSNHDIGKGRKVGEQSEDVWKCAVSRGCHTWRSGRSRRNGTRCAGAINPLECARTA